MDKPNGIEAQPVQMHEIVIRMAGGQIQVGTTPMDDLLKFGMIEMAKLALIEQRIMAASGKGPPLIVPARFSS